MHSSVNWYFQNIDNIIGMDNVKLYLQNIGYGNQQTVRSALNICGKIIFVTGFFNISDKPTIRILTVYSAVISTYSLCQKTLQQFSVIAPPSSCTTKSIPFVSWPSTLPVPVLPERVPSAVLAMRIASFTACILLSEKPKSLW